MFPWGMARPAPPSRIRSPGGSGSPPVEQASDVVAFSPELRGCAVPHRATSILAETINIHIGIGLRLYAYHHTVSRQAWLGANCLWPDMCRMN